MANSRDIDQVDRVLDLNKTYNITNAVVLPSKYNVQPPSPHYKYVWMLNRQTYIEKVPDSNEIEISNKQEDTLTAFHEFYNLIGTKCPINFMAIVLEKMPREYISVKKTVKTAYEFTVVNEEMKPMLLTLWEDFAIYQGKELMSVLDCGRFPIILGKRVIVNNFNGVSLCAQSDSIFEVNPTNPRSESLKRWRDESIDLMKRYIDLKTYKHALIALAYPPGQLKTKVVNIAEMNTQGKGVWVEVHMRIIDDAASFYIGCDYCNRKVCGPEGGSYRCLDCGNPNARAEKKYKMEVELSDETGEIVGTIFDEDFNRLLQITNTIHRSGSIEIAKLQAKMDGKKFFCEVRVDNKQFPGKSKQTYTINGVCENVKVSQPVGVPANDEGPSTGRRIIRTLTFEEPLEEHEGIINPAIEERCGANDEATSIGGSIIRNLSFDGAIQQSEVTPLAPLNRVYSTVIQQEGIIKVTQEEEKNPVGFAVINNRDNNRDLKCKHCGQTGHEMSGCFQLIGYPEWWGDRPRFQTARRGAGRGGATRGRQGGRGSGGGRGNRPVNGGGVTGPAAHTARARGNNGQKETITSQQWNTLMELLKEKEVPLDNKFSDDDEAAPAVPSEHFTPPSSQPVPIPVEGTTGADETETRPTNNEPLTTNNTTEADSLDSPTGVAEPTNLLRRGTRERQPSTRLRDFVVHTIQQPQAASPFPDPPSAATPTEITLSNINHTSPLPRPLGQLQRPRQQQEDLVMVYTEFESLQERNAKSHKDQALQKVQLQPTTRSIHKSEAFMK
ncbi:unnamed protein product [Cuscuta campestris]|uniref:Replication factor A C-terminal domain-containing protein n=1 Tax=Cuscuta campestris TaxID=132261 RepID=A0A484LA05_9ASTE|nr:unnamed protein product [Cuscuta campestris]